MQSSVKSSVYTISASGSAILLEEFEAMKVQSKIVTLDFPCPAADAGDGAAACS